MFSRAPCTSGRLGWSYSNFTRDWTLFHGDSGQPDRSDGLHGGAKGARRRPLSSACPAPPRLHCLFLPPIDGTIAARGKARQRHNKWHESRVRGGAGRRPGIHHCDGRVAGSIPGVGRGAMRRSGGKIEARAILIAASSRALWVRVHGVHAAGTLSANGA